MKFVLAILATLTLVFTAPARADDHPPMDCSRRAGR